MFHFMTSRGKIRLTDAEVDALTLPGQHDEPVRDSWADRFFDLVCQDVPQQYRTPR